VARRRTERLEEVRWRLVRWRERHGGRGRPIPEELWTAAAAVASVEGVDATARVLGVDRARLARRVVSSPSMVTAPQRVARFTPPEAAFVELPRVQSPPAGQIVVRLSGRDGEQMEIIGGTEVLAVVRELWNRAR
jgi:hypothetical protein